MTKRKLARVRDRFLSDLDQCNTFVDRCKSARAATGSRAAFTTTQLHWAYEHALLKATMAWEVYLEFALAHYVMGERAPSGRQYAINRRIEAATLRDVRGTFHGDGEFVTWLSVDAVTDRAEKWLRGGGPFTALSSAGSPLSYVRLARNAVAHNSDSAWEKFEDKTRKLYGSVPPKLSPGRQLAAPPPGSLGIAGASLFEAVLALLRTLASQVTP